MYSDRINTYNRMKILDAELDTKPTKQRVAEMAELRIRNLLCFKELQSFNDSSGWLGRHPLISHRSAYARLEDLYNLDQPKFLDEYNNCRNNIARYESYMRSDKRINNRDTDKALLEKHRERKSIFESIMENNKL